MQRSAHAHRLCSAWISFHCRDYFVNFFFLCMSEVSFFSFFQFVLFWSFIYIFFKKLLGFVEWEIAGLKCGIEICEFPETFESNHSMRFGKWFIFFLQQPPQMQNIERYTSSKKWRKKSKILLIVIMEQKFKSWDAVKEKIEFFSVFLHSCLSPLDWFKGLKRG